MRIGSSMIWTLCFNVIWINWKLLVPTEKESAALDIRDESVLCRKLNFSSSFRAKIRLWNLSFLNENNKHSCSCHSPKPANSFSSPIKWSLLSLIFGFAFVNFNSFLFFLPFVFTSQRIHSCELHFHVTLHVEVKKESEIQINVCTRKWYYGERWCCRCASIELDE